MERRAKRLICLGASICGLAVLAITMFIGASRTGFFTPEISFNSDQEPEIRPISESGKSNF